MVEINNQHGRRSSICWRGRRELIAGRQKTRNHGYDVIVGGELFTDYSDHPHQTKPKTQINRRRTLPAAFPLVGCLRKRQRNSLRKSGRCGIAAD